MTASAGPQKILEPANAARISEQERRQLVSELFHALSQPLTALRCSLEMALSGRFSPGPSQENLQLALEHAEQIARLATGMRELLEADAPGSARTLVNLETCLGEAVVDLVPVAEAAGVQLRFRPGRLPGGSGAASAAASAVLSGGVGASLGGRGGERHG